MNCPKCDSTVDAAAAECPRCGVILAKAIQEAWRPPTARRATDAPATRSPNSPLRAVAGIVALLTIVLFIRSRHNTSSGDALLPGWYAGASGYSRGISEQSQTRKPVLVYFHTEWCGWCKKLDSDVFATADFASRYDSVIKVKVNPELGAAERDIAAQYGVEGYPTVVVISGERHESIVGYLEPAAYMARLDSLVN